jgi:hypothetical protein
MQDDRPKREAEVQAIRVPEGQPRDERGRFAQHPLVEQFLVAAERWALRDFAGLDASSELDHMRDLAALMLTDEWPLPD